MAFDPWGTATGIVAAIFGGLGLRFFKRIDELETDVAELKEALKLQGAAYDRFVDGTVKDLKRTVRELYAKAHPRALPPISDD